MEWKKSDLLEFDLTREQDLANLDRLKVPGPTCLGGGHLALPGRTLGYGEFPHQTPLEPIGEQEVTENDMK